MGKLKVRVGDQWEEVTPTVPDEVHIAVEDPYVTDPTSTAELWYDPDAVRPPSMEEEVYVGPDDPDIIAPLNTVDLWYDPDDTTTGTLRLDQMADVQIIGSMAHNEVLTYDDTSKTWRSYPPPSGVPGGGTTGQALSKVDDVDGNVEWSGPYARKDEASLKARVYAHHLYGRVTDPGTTWAVVLAAGTYLCQFAMSAIATVTGIRYLNLQMDGVDVNQSKLWFNELNSHRMMNQGVAEVEIPADGTYTFTLVASASLSTDQNDFGWIILTPAETGAVS